MDRQAGREYRGALDSLCFSGEEKERIMNHLMERQEQRPAKRRGIRPLRAGLIAAALCAALLGTAGAAQFLGARIDWQAKDPLVSGSSYGAKVDTTCFPADSFPQQIQDMAEQGSLTGKNFKSWVELEEFLGRDLPDSVALGSAKPGPLALISSSDKKGETNILLCVSACKQGIFSIEATGHYILDGIWIQQEARLYTDKAEENYKQAGLEFESGEILIYEDGGEMTDETYTTPSGLTATIVTVVLPEGYGRSSTRYNAHFSISGIEYRVTASFYKAGMTAAEAAAKDDPAHTLAVLKQVLDGFAV